MQPSRISDARISPSVFNRRSVTRLGYIGLVDAAPLIVAAEYGLFEKKGLNVALSREVGWATIREKINFGELEAAHALCTLPFASSFGMGAPAVSCITGLVLSRGGNAIVLSEELRRRGVKNKETLKMDVDNRKAFRKYKFATVYACSSHNFHLREWLIEAGIDPEEDVELVTLPPTQMCRNLHAGTIDGFCAGEPWGSLAISQKIGWSPVNSVDLSPGHPEKVLMVRERFAEEHPDEHIALMSALIEACALCDDPTHRSEISEMISDRKRINCPAELIEQCLSPQFNYGLGRVESSPAFMRFYAQDSNRPSAADREWIVSRLVENCGQIDAAAVDRASTVFREDLYEKALSRARFVPA
ncbi:ABC transporter substrate-binding protein [Pelagicoccus sp. SDUM812003]|uniref:ABC transporter substrate-binding protein n=1 Tax=Pelagicoccus sp. SDUM812003 TaxID=3041267 RepID=UPI00280D4897|nr:ABC transporter substrate-binding protein [Pelagicoccus sp. SDUM812003]MDQ8203795.1 ABC transporter substrate-binding protein [Pelagicoccus sp. SDUM812003]